MQTPRAPSAPPRGAGANDRAGAEDLTRQGSPCLCNRQVSVGYGLVIEALLRRASR